MTGTVLITGATGMVGGQVLDLVLADPRIGRVIALGRRPTGITNAKLQDVVHTDFGDLSPIHSRLMGVDVCFHCLAVYQSQVTADAYAQITCDYLQGIIDALQATSPGATFVLFSAQGADPTGKSRAAFARVKGRAETLLDAAQFPRTYIFRPGYIHATGRRRPPGIGYRLLAPVGVPLMRLLPDAGTTDRELAQAMVTVGLAGTAGSRVFESRDIRAVIRSAG